MGEPKIFVAFAGTEVIARGPLGEVVGHSKRRFDGGEDARIAVFDDETGRVVDVDLVGREAAVMARLKTYPAIAGEAQKPEKQKGPGRPKLGVVSREVSLLPRHWQWLSEQRGGASAAIRRLVDSARKLNTTEEQTRRLVEAAHRFMWDIAGNLPDFEEASRCLFAQDFARFAKLTAAWPVGIREQLGRYTDRVREVDGDGR